MSQLYAYEIEIEYVSQQEAEVCMDLLEKIMDFNDFTEENYYKDLTTLLLEGEVALSARHSPEEMDKEIRKIIQSRYPFTSITTKWRNLNTIYWDEEFEESDETAE